MPITITCTACGRKQQVREALGGKRVKCPGCGAAVEVPEAEAWTSSEPEGGASGLEQIRQCPSCKKEWPAATLVCTNCGYNFQTGRKLKTIYKVSQRTADFGIRFLGTFARYTIGRSRTGDLIFARKDWFVFIPFGTRTHNLRGYDTAVASYTRLSRKSEFSTIVVEGKGKEPLELYSGNWEQELKWLLDALQQIGGLTIKRL
jgi:predicted RNA-binding Zn-ribbon protein involved in translation (DUF1610 family)